MRSNFFTITILALCLATYSQAAQGNCPKEYMCKGCSNDAITCFSCFNAQSSAKPLQTTNGARQLSGSSCATVIANGITDCKYYKGTISATKTTGDCKQCNSKTWLNVKDNATAANIEITCSDTSIDATTCDKKVDNCDQSFCFKNTSNTFVKGCAKCASGYKGNGTLTTGLGYASCVNTSVIANCAVADPVDNTKCQTCKDNFAVAYANDTSCTAFTTDANCRKLGGDAWCKECKDGYIFDGRKCIAAASMMIFSTTILAAMAFFF